MTLPIGRVTCGDPARCEGFGPSENGSRPLSPGGAMRTFELLTRGFPAVFTRSPIIAICFSGCGQLAHRSGIRRRDRECDPRRVDAAGSPGDRPPASRSTRSRSATTGDTITRSPPTSSPPAVRGAGVGLNNGVIRDLVCVEHRLGRRLHGRAGAVPRASRPVGALSPGWSPDCSRPTSDVTLPPVAGMPVGRRVYDAGSGAGPGPGVRSGMARGRGRSRGSRQPRLPTGVAWDAASRAASVAAIRQADFGFTRRWLSARGWPGAQSPARFTRLEYPLHPGRRWGDSPRTRVSKSIGRRRRCAGSRRRTRAAMANSGSRANSLAPTSPRPGAGVRCAVPRRLEPRAALQGAAKGPRFKGRLGEDLASSAITRP